MTLDLAARIGTILNIAEGELSSKTLPYIARLCREALADVETTYIKRFTDGGPDGWMQTPTGEFVRYDDIKHLLRAQETASLDPNSRCMNCGVKRSLHNAGGVGGCGIWAEPAQKT